MSAAGGAGSSSPRVKLSDEILNCSVCRDEYTIGGIKGVSPRSHYNQSYSGKQPLPNGALI